MLGIRPAPGSVREDTAGVGQPQMPTAMVATRVRAAMMSVHLTSDSVELSRESRSLRFSPSQWSAAKCFSGVE